jgi:hypothetical protein
MFYVYTDVYILHVSREYQYHYHIFNMYTRYFVMNIITIYYMHNFFICICMYYIIYINLSRAMYAA